MKKALTLIFALLGLQVMMAQNYFHPTVGVQNTYNGACLVTTCSGNYFDNGGNGGNYAANVNNIYRTFCPNTAGMCMRATFNSFSMNDTYFLCFGPNSCCDYLQILNGPAQNSPALYNNCTTSPGTITATNASGCLTFRFVSDGSVQLGGWAATLSCVPCGVGPAGNTNSDCAFATPICSNVSFNDVATGPGIVGEGCSGCNTSEVYTNWYRIQIATSGTLAFTINPNNNSDDFDPVVYGPNVSCGSLGSPIRCSYAANAGNGNTGLGNGAGDNSEDVAGDQWVAPLNVTAGQTYYVLVNGWSASSGTNGFAMSWTGTASLNCTILAAEIVDFKAEYMPEQASTELVVQTAQEEGMTNLAIERASELGDWHEIHAFEPGGSNSMYIFYDPSPRQGLNQYRIRMEDASGATTYGQTIMVEVPLEEALYVYPNPTSGSLTVEAGGKMARSGNLILYNTMGQEVLRDYLKIEQGQMTLVELNLSQLPTGIYYAKFGSKTVRFLKTQ